MGRGPSLCFYLVVVVVVVVVVNSRNTSDFCDCVGPEKSSNRLCWRIFFTRPEQKHRKYQCFWRLGSPKPRYLRRFFLLLAKSTVFIVFFAPAEQQHWYLRSFQRVARCRFYIWKTKNTVFYDVFASRPQKKDTNNGSKTDILAPMSSHLDPS